MAQKVQRIILEREGEKLMKIAFSSTGRDLDSEIDPRFGRVCILFNC